MTSQVFWAYVQIPVFIMLYFLAGYSTSLFLKTALNKKYIKIGIIITLASIFANFVYSGFFGYDHLFSSNWIEFVLDTVSGITLLVGMGYYYTGCGLFGKWGRNKNG